MIPIEPTSVAFNINPSFRVSFSERRSDSRSFCCQRTASNETEASNLGLPTHLDAFSDDQITTKVGQRFRVKLRARDMEYSADGGVYLQHNLHKESEAVSAHLVGI